MSTYYQTETVNACINYYCRIHPNHKRLDDMIDIYTDLKTNGKAGIFADELPWGVEYMLANYQAKKKGL